MTRILLHSGGLDSHICWLMDRDVQPVYVLHGNGNREREQAALEALRRFHELDDRPFSWQVVRGHDLSSTVQRDGHIAFRNLYLILRAAMAYPDLTEIAYGALRGEASPDKSPRFVRAAERALTESEGRSIKVTAPLLALTKPQALRMAQKLRGAGALALTHSCYHDQAGGPCGKCQACYRRHLAEWGAGLRSDPPAALPGESDGALANLRRTPVRRWPALAAANLPAARAWLKTRRGDR